MCWHCQIGSEHSFLFSPWREEIALFIKGMFLIQSLDGGKALRLPEDENECLVSSNVHVFNHMTNLSYPSIHPYIVHLSIHPHLSIQVMSWRGTMEVQKGRSSCPQNCTDFWVNPVGCVSLLSSSIPPSLSESLQTSGGTVFSGMIPHDPAEKEMEGYFCLVCLFFLFINSGFKMLKTWVREEAGSRSRSACWFLSTSQIGLINAEKFKLSFWWILWIL